MDRSEGSLGKVLKTPCSRSVVLKMRRKFSRRGLNLQGLKNGFNASALCQEHETESILRYPDQLTKCSDPFTVHKAYVRKQLKTISFELHDKCKNFCIPGIKQGEKLCITCRKAVYIKVNTKETSPQVHDPDEKGSKTSTLSVHRNQASDGLGPSGLHHQSGGIESEERASDPESGTSLDSQESHVSGSERREKSDGAFSPKKAVLERLNRSIVTLGSSPVDVKKVTRSKKYRSEKSMKVQSTFWKSFKKITDEREDNSCGNGDFGNAGAEIMQQLKERFNSEETLAIKIQILSILPKSWSVSRIMKEFSVSRYMVLKMKELREEQGILCTPHVRIGRSMSFETVKKVVSFYRDPDISREMPGRKQCKSVKEGSKRILKQKRLVLGNLKEIFILFKERFPKEFISFSKFAYLRPTECVLAGASGTHTVCVCLIHQNTKLMFEGAKLGQLKGENGETVFKSYRDCLQMAVCEIPGEICYFGSCSKCPPITKLRGVLESALDFNFIEDVSYQQWVQLDRCALETVSKTSDEFIDFFVEKIPDLVRHDYVAKQQADFFRHTRENLAVGEALVVADFSENYSFVLQESVQGVHWNNRQATVHPFACYYRPDEGKEVSPLNLVVISDCTAHVTATVHCFQHSLISFLRGTVTKLKKVIYFSDGSTAQYKNRYNLLNLVHHEKDFKVAAEWHFFATSHGKGPSDGLGGTVKRLAARASLQLPLNLQIQTPYQLHEWAAENIKGINFAYVSNVEVEDKKKRTTRRCEQAPAVKGIRSYHAAIPAGDGFLILKKLSSSADERLVRMTGTTKTQPRRRLLV